MVVLDEADQVIRNLGPEIKTIFKSLLRKRQTLLFSATLMTKNNDNAKRGRRQQQQQALSPETIMAEPIVGIQDIDCVS